MVNSVYKLRGHTCYPQFLEFVSRYYDYNLSQSWSCVCPTMVNLHCQLQFHVLRKRIQWMTYERWSKVEIGECWNGEWGSFIWFYLWACNGPCQWNHCLMWEWSPEEEIVTRDGDNSGWGSPLFQFQAEVDHSSGPTWTLHCKDVNVAQGAQAQVRRKAEVISGNGQRQLQAFCVPFTTLRNFLASTGLIKFPKFRNSIF